MRTGAVLGTAAGVLDELWEEVEEGAMPQARLSDADKETLRGWALAPPG